MRKISIYIFTVLISTFVYDQSSYNIDIFHDCPSVETSPFVDLCNEGGSHDLASHQVTTEPGTWTIDSSSVDISSLVFNASGLKPGLYTLRFTITNQQEGCPSFSEQTILVLEPKYAGIPIDTFFCHNDNQTIHLKDLLDDPDDGGKWTSSVVIGFNATLGTFNTTGQSVNSFSFTYGFQNVAPCPQTSANVIVNIIQSPTADAGQNQFIDCDHPDAILDGTGSGIANLTYQWLDPNRNIITGANAPTYTTNAEGQYTLIITHTITGCSSEDIVRVISDSDKPQFKASLTDPICTGENTGAIHLINIKGGDGNYEYKLDSNAYGPTPSWTSLVAGNYTVYMKDGTDCETFIPITLVEPDSLFLKISTGSYQIDMETKDTLSFTTNADGNTSEIVWTSNANEICDSSIGDHCDSIDVTTEETTTYCATITDQNGCTATDCITIEIIDKHIVYIPNVFNPTLSDEQGYFYISDNQEVINIQDFRVYSRWGELIFRTKHTLPNAINYQDGWNGTFKGEIVNPGVYVYLIEVLYDDYTEELFSGSVTVIR